MFEDSSVIYAGLWGCTNMYKWEILIFPQTPWDCFFSFGTFGFWISEVGNSYEIEITDNQLRSTRR